MYYINTCPSLSTETAPSIFPEHVQNTANSLSKPKPVFPESLLPLLKRRCTHLLSLSHAKRR